jgi:hypothetical protein
MLLIALLLPCFFSETHTSSVKGAERGYFVVERVLTATAAIHGGCVLVRHNALRSMQR